MTILVILGHLKGSKSSKILGQNYIVTSSKGHLRDLDKSKLSIDINNDFKPN